MYLGQSHDELEECRYAAESERSQHRNEMHLEVLLLNANRKFAEEVEDNWEHETERFRAYQATVGMEVTQERRVLIENTRYWEAEARRLAEESSERQGEMDVDQATMDGAARQNAEY